MSITDVVCNTKDISNEKIKQKDVLQPDGTSFAGIENLKSWTDQTDKYLIYKISINEEYIFKTSKQKLLLANDVDSRSSHYLNYEFCYFDGKVGRVKDFITLTASVYHTLLKRQITLATMECKHEDSRHAKLFWNLYNDAYKETNNTTLKYEPVGWCSDMAGKIFYFNILSLTFSIMLQKDEQNASKTQVANHKKTDSNIVLLLICDIIIYTDGLYKIRFNISALSGRLIDQSRSFVVEGKPEKSELVFRIYSQLSYRKRH